MVGARNPLPLRWMSHLKLEAMRPLINAISASDAAISRIGVSRFSHSRLLALVLFLDDGWVCFSRLRYSSGSARAHPHQFRLGALLFRVCLGWFLRVAVALFACPLRSWCRQAISGTCLLRVASFLPSPFYLALRFPRSPPARFPRVPSSFFLPFSSASPVPICSYWGFASYPVSAHCTRLTPSTFPVFRAPSSRS